MRVFSASVLVMTSCALQLACGAHGANQIETHALRVLEWERASPRVVSLDELELPESGELILEPVQLRVPEASHQGQGYRVQFVIRALQRDGGVRQWFVGADGRASAGERGFQMSPGQSTRPGFGGADYGPMRVSSLVHLELAVARMPLEPSREASFVGAAALRELVDDSIGSAQHVAEEGGTLLLAKRLPVVARDGVPGRQTLRLIVTGSEESPPPAVEHAHTFDGARLLDAQGERLEPLSFVVLDLHVVVPHHE